MPGRWRRTVIAGTTNPAYPSAALIDSNQRGYAPWGLANVVAGPQSGYAWEFDFAKYVTCDPLPYAPSKQPVSTRPRKTSVPGSASSIPAANSPTIRRAVANPPVQPYSRGRGCEQLGVGFRPER